MADHLRKYESLWVSSLSTKCLQFTDPPAPSVIRFTLTPQRMRMIVEAFKDTLEIGLEKPKQIVVSLNKLLNHRTS